MATDTPFQGDVLITERKETAQGYTYIQFKWQGPPPAAGQFVTLKNSRPDGTLLRRPLAFAHWDARKQEAGILFQIRGSATQALDFLPPGNRVNALGPLGRSFSPTPQNHGLILVGGGIGTGPILFRQQEETNRGGKPLLVLGFRSKDLIPRDLLPPPTDAETVICTDDGSEGFKGTVVDYLKSKASLDNPERPFFQSCGPYPMMRGLHHWCLEKGYPLEVSLEEMMACGVGVCNGCAVPMADSTAAEPHYQKVCVDGPIFNSREISWT